MKKIIFILLLPISVFAKDWDSIPRLMFKANPILLSDGFDITGYELGMLCEYKFCTKKSIEFGGGYIKSNNPYQPVYGYTLRAGIRFYQKSGAYLEPALFFRYEYYPNRNYDWVKNDSVSDLILETGELPGVDGGRDDDKHMIAIERKYVYSFQLLYGYEHLLFDKIPIDVYCGVGLRYKHRALEILNENYGIGGHFYANYNPPKPMNINTVLPTIQFGIRIGLAFKLKKNKLYH